MVSDAHEGFKAAAAEAPRSPWQRCRVHFMRNALAHVPKGQRQMVAALIRTAFKRCADAVGIFPNERAVIRLAGAILMEQSEEWAVQRRYMTLEAMVTQGSQPSQ